MEELQARTALVELLAAALDVVPHPLIVSDFRIVLFANERMRELLRYTDRSQLEGLDPLRIFHPDVHEAVKARREVLRRGSCGFRNVPIKLVAADGTVINATVSIAPIVHQGLRFAVFSYEPVR